MSIENFIIEYWFILFWFLPLLYLYIRQKNKDRIANLTYSEAQIIIEIGFILLLIYMIQKYIFYEHMFFLIAIPLSFFIYWVLISYLLKGNEVYIIESTIMNEKHFDIINKEINISTTNQSRMLIMDKSHYETKKHVGDSDFSFWDGSDRIKFCDYYSDINGIFYHPQLPQFHNVSIHMARAFLQKIKEDIPKLYYDNIMLTWLSPYKTAYQLNTMKKNFPYHLLAIESQYEYNPFKIPQTTEEIFTEQFLSQMKEAKEHEKLKQMTSEEMESEIKALLKGDGKE